LGLELVLGLGLQLAQTFNGNNLGAGELADKCHNLAKRSMLLMLTKTSLVVTGKLCQFCPMLT